MRFAIVTAPTVEPVTFTDYQTHTRFDGTDENTTGAIYVKAAREYIEELCGPIMAQTWDAYLDGWPCDDTITIWKKRVTEITSIKYTIRDASAASTFAAASYLTDFISPYALIRLKYGETWPSDDLEVLNPIVIRFACGYPAGTGVGHEADNVPAEFKQAVFMLAAHWYGNRETVQPGAISEPPFAVSALIANLGRDWGE